ncbi:hypothetical protein GGR58DRAFT_509436 [Xylaria digitata]|nr:hypothetical protein GGR58DRAFT_509436 [Xylaria digitata]
MTQTVQKRHRQASCGRLPDDGPLSLQGIGQYRNVMRCRKAQSIRGIGIYSPVVFIVGTVAIVIISSSHHLIILLIAVVVVIIALFPRTVRSRSKQILPELVAPCSPRVSFHTSATARRGEMIDYPVSTLLFRQRVKARRVTRSGNWRFTITTSASVSERPAYAVIISRLDDSLARAQPPLPDR